MDKYLQVFAIYQGKFAQCKRGITEQYQFNLISPVYDFMNTSTVSRNVKHLETGLDNITRPLAQGIENCLVSDFCKVWVTYFSSFWIYSGLDFCKEAGWYQETSQSVGCKDSTEVTAEQLSLLVACFETIFPLNSFSNSYPNNCF